MEKASFAERFMAWLVDIVVLAVLAGGLMLLFSLIAGLGSASESNILAFLTATLLVIGLVVLVFLQFLYYGYFWSKGGSSPGMKLFRIKVVRRKTGAPVSFARAGLRGSLGYWISTVVFYLGFIWAAFDADSEAWHDKIFDTWVVSQE